ncbi:MAG: TrkA C-terminal domain-containing protein, partial [Bacteroidota bacterium]
DVLIEVWSVALILFGVRLLSMIMAGYVGGYLGGDPKEYLPINWMPYVTQAGVGLGLTIIVADANPAWGQEFATIVIGVIVLNQVVGPPLFKWAIQRVGEDHSLMATPEFDGVRDAIIFGAHRDGIALARSLSEHGWLVKIVTFREDISDLPTEDLDIRQITELTPEVMRALDTEQAEAIVGWLSDDLNFQVCDLAAEYLGTKDLIVMLEDGSKYNKFKDLGVKLVHPRLAMVSLLDHLVRSPIATQMLLGIGEGEGTDTIEIEVQDDSLMGMRLRDLKLPEKVIVLSIQRGDQLVIPSGYTRLRIHDYITLVGPEEDLEVAELRFLRAAPKSSPNPFSGGGMPHLPT